MSCSPQEVDALNVIWTMNEASERYDHHTIADAIAVDWVRAHELCADLEWRGFLRRHGPECRSITLTERGAAYVKGARFKKAFTRENEHDRRI